jgi:hypothetical protein
MLIKREVLESVLPACTSDDSRYYLTAVQIQPDGTVEATDGHIALRAKGKHDCEDADFPIVPGAPELQEIAKPILVGRETVKRLIAGTPKRATIPVLTEIRVGQDGADPVLLSTDLTVPVIIRVRTDEQGKFPNLDPVFPKDRPELHLRLGLNVLEHLCKAMKAAYKGEHGGRGREPSIVLYVPTEDQYRKQDRTAHEAAAKGETVYTNQIISGVRVAVQSSDVDLRGVVMPFGEP